MAKNLGIIPIFFFTSISVLVLYLKFSPSSTVFLWLELIYSAFYKIFWKKQYKWSELKKAYLSRRLLAGTIFIFLPVRLRLRLGPSQSRNRSFSNSQGPGGWVLVAHGEKARGHLRFSARSKVLDCFKYWLKFSLQIQFKTTLFSAVLSTSISCGIVRFSLLKNTL